MKLVTFTHSASNGWSVPSFPDLDSSNTLVVVFGASSYGQSTEAIGQLAASYPNACLMGCSTSGEINDTELNDESLSVAVVSFERSELRSAAAAVEDSSDSYSAGKALAQELMAPDLRGVMVLSDGLNVNGTELIQGLNEILPESVVVTGGLAGDGTRFENTWVLKDGKPRCKLATAVGFYGDHIRIGHGSKGGWDIFGPDRLVTKSDKNVLYELDGQPALDLYKSYLGELADELPSSGLLFPLSIRANVDDQEPVVRTLLAVDEEAKSMTFAGDIKEGYLAQLMKANIDRLIDGASEAALMTKERGSDADGDTLSIAISCVGRRLVLGERTEDELESTLEVLPNGTRQIGFYSYGEISPFSTGHCDLHNQTMTLTTIQEAGCLA